MTFSETANFLNLSTQTVRKQIKAGRIKATLYNKQFRIQKAQFHESN